MRSHQPNHVMRICNSSFSYITIALIISTETNICKLFSGTHKSGRVPTTIVGHANNHISESCIHGRTTAKRACHPAFFLPSDHRLLRRLVRIPFRSLSLIFLLLTEPPNVEFPTSVRREFDHKLRSDDDTMGHRGSEPPIRPQA